MVAAPRWIHREGPAGHGSHSCTTCGRPASSDPVAGAHPPGGIARCWTAIASCGWWAGSATDTGEGEGDAEDGDGVGITVVPAVGVGAPLVQAASSINAMPRRPVMRSGPGDRPRGSSLPSADISSGGGYPRPSAASAPEMAVVSTRSRAARRLPAAMLAAATVAPTRKMIVAIANTCGGIPIFDDP
jgi:hypothetical protein